MRQQYINKLWCCTLICLFFLGISQAGECRVQSQEWKLLISPALFSADRETGYQVVADRLAATAATLSMTANLVDGKEKGRLIRYFDTIDRDLARQHYILRQRIRIKKGVVQDFGDLTVKLRLPAEDQVAAQNFATALAESAKIKVEADTIGFIDQQVGKSQTAVSISATRKAIPALEILSTALAQDYFPNLPVGATGDLSIIGQALEYSKMLGEVTDESLNPLAIDIAIWYDPATEQCLLAEISWKASVNDAAAQQLFLAMQESNQDILLSGAAKTATLTD